MKKATILLLFLAGFALSAQSYYPLITQGKQTTFLNSCGTCPANMEGFIHFYFDGDTTIGSHTYQKLMYQFHTPLINDVALSELLREDTIAHKIYRFSGTKRDSLHGMNYQTDVLLFDYDYQVGDSVHMLGFGPPFDEWTKITSIDTVTLSNQHRVRFYKGTINGNPGSIIFAEEVLLAHEYMIYTGPYSHSIWYGCAMGLNGIGLFPSNCTSNYFVGLEEQSPGFLAIYPNPTSEHLVLNAPLAGEFELYDVLGKRVLQATLSGEEQKTVSVSNLPAGLFVWVFRTGKGVEKGKLLIENQ